MEMHKHGDGSKVALLLHGMASSSNTWGNLIKDLIENDYTVYAPDLPGHGVAAKDPELYRLEKWEELLLNELPSVNLLVGHSMGGLLAIRLRPKLKPAKTVLIDPVLRFPVGPLKVIAQELFGRGMQLTRFSKKEDMRANIRSWDPSAVRMIESPRGLTMLQGDVLVVRPKGSYVAPLIAFKNLPKVKVVTLAKANHNLHLYSYSRFYEIFQDFVLRGSLAS